MYGAPVTLTATVDSVGTGRVTFYDGATLLGIRTLSGGQAVLTTRLLPAGRRQLRAHYSGDGTHGPGDSATVPGVVSSAAAGAFQAAVNYPVGDTPNAVTVGDFNLDGKADIAVVNRGSNNVTVRLGNGDGTFGAGANYAVASQPGSLAVADFNGDGSADLAVSNAGSNNVSILSGRGDGTFEAARNIAAGSGPASVAAGDFNGDGIADLAVANAASNKVGILLGAGDGTFGAQTEFAVGTEPVSVTIADFNGDGRMDLVTANKSSNDVSVLLGKGDGTFQAAVNYRLTSANQVESPLSIATGDFNSDGKTDLMVANSVGILGSGLYVSNLMGHGDGTFGTARRLDQLGAIPPYGVVAGDFNGDGDLDVAVINKGTFNQAGDVGIIFGLGDGQFQIPLPSNYSAGASPLAGAVGDFNGDGRTDLVVVNSGDGTVSVLSAGEAPELTCSPASLTFVVTSPDQDAMNRWCLVTMKSFGSVVSASNSASMSDWPWFKTTTSPAFAPAVLEGYIDGLKGFLPSERHGSINVWDTNTGARIRVPVTLIISESVCGLLPTPPEDTFLEFGGTKSFTISTSRGCNWTVSSDSPWLTFTLEPRITIGNKVSQVVNFKAQPNTEGARTGHIRVGVESFTVSQAGPRLQPISGVVEENVGKFVFKDSEGETDLIGDVWFAQSSIEGDNSATCKFYYVAGTKQIHLVDDTGLLESTATVGVAGSLQNSRCILDIGLSTAAWNGDELTLMVPMTFLPPSKPNLIIWMAARGALGGSGWKQMGGLNLFGPELVSVVSTKPCCGSGNAQTFTFTYRHSYGGREPRFGVGLVHALLRSGKRGPHL